MSKERIITVADEIDLLPIVGFLALVGFVISGALPWQLLVVLALFSMKGVVTINWRKLINGPSGDNG